MEELCPCVHHYRLFDFIYAAVQLKKKKKTINYDSTYKAISGSQLIPNNHCRPTGTNTSRSFILGNNSYKPTIP